MSQTTEVRIPKLGVYVEGMRLAAWLVDEGARVEAGESLFELESDKASQGVDAEVAGWLLQRVEPDAEVEVGQVIGLIAATEESYRAASASEPAAAPTSEPAPAPAAPTPANGHAPAVAPRARRLLDEHGLTAAEVAAWVTVVPGARLTDRDVTAYLARAGASAPAAPPADDGGLTVVERTPLRGRRGVIAARMVASLRDAPQLTSVLEVDATAALELRERTGVRHVTVFAAAAARALRAHPALNALVADDEIRVVEEINLAIAVETEDGVIAPVVHGADMLSLAALDVVVGDLVERARVGRCTPAELGGATFTLSSSGRHAVDLTTAILSPPQAGILWLGRARVRPIVRDDAIVAAPTVQACLTYDHRAVDGGPAAAFLGAFAEALEDPA